MEKQCNQDAEPSHPYLGAMVTPYTGEELYILGMETIRAHQLYKGLSAAGEASGIAAYQRTRRWRTTGGTL